jgi:hypothetical protein
MTTAIELERLQFGLLHCLLVRMLKRDDVAPLTGAMEYECALSPTALENFIGTRS